MYIGLRSRDMISYVLYTLVLFECAIYANPEESSNGDIIHWYDRRFNTGRKSVSTGNSTRALCSLPKKAGNCRERLQRFYFDEIVGECVGFIYTGCWGNGNRFSTRQQCETRCMTGVETSPCADGYRKSKINSGYNRDIIPGCSDRPCKEGFTCVTDRRRVSACCDNVIEDKYASAKSSLCSNGMQAQRTAVFSEILFGIKCEDLRCDEGFECIKTSQQFAKCCQRKGSSGQHSAQKVVPIPTLTSLNGRKRDSGGAISRIQVKTQNHKKYSAVCKLPKEAGSCKDAGNQSQQMFYYDPEWQSCVAFKYSGCGGNANKFPTRDQCESECFYADGSACKGPVPAKVPQVQDSECREGTCPQGFTCTYGFGFLECCNTTVKNEIKAAYSPKCPDGSQSGGRKAPGGDYFQATFAKNCNELICDCKQRCVQVSSNFAKCCGEVEETSPSSVKNSDDVTNEPRNEESSTKSVLENSENEGKNSTSSQLS